jgi:hypothetical protein
MTDICCSVLDGNRDALAPGDTLIIPRTAERVILREVAESIPGRRTFAEFPGRLDSATTGADAPFAQNDWLKMPLELASEPRLR